MQFGLRSPEDGIVALRSNRSCSYSIAFDRAVLSLTGNLPGADNDSGGYAVVTSGNSLDFTGERFIGTALGAIAGATEEFSKVFMLAVDGLTRDLPATKVLRRRLEVLIDRFVCD